MNYKEIALNNRKSIKRAMARFCYLKSVIISEDNFNTWVRRTQESGYPSAIKYLSKHLQEKMISYRQKKQLLLQFTIEYNIEMYLKQFPNGNKTVERIVMGSKTTEDIQFFKESLFDIVKANKLQLQIIDEFI